MVKKEPQNCWEFMECSEEIRKKCIVYEVEAGRDCWYLTDSKEGCPASKKFGNCTECLWYQKLNAQA